MLARASGSVICPFNSILGLVAQLGAHHIRIVGVEGSNPFESTKRRKITDFAAFSQLFASINFI